MDYQLYHNMPIYEYQREDGSVFELNQKMSEDALTHCPETGQAVKRMISGGSGVIYKGEGWYVTDYKNKTSDSVKTETTPKTDSTSD